MSPSAATPAVTTFTSAVDGHTKGDVVISMPEDLARRMDELIRRSSQCPTADEFNKGLQKRLNDFGAVICAAEAVIINAAPGTAFADYLVVRPRPFPWTAGDAVRAMNVVMQFARGYAPALQLDPETAAAVGVGAFAVAWEVLINNKPLSTSNVIPAQSLSGTITSMCSTTRADECLVNCRMIGAIERCGTTCAKKTGCGATALRTATIVPWTAAAADAQPTEPPAPPVPRPQCNMEDASGLPFNVFKSVYGQFCGEVDKAKSALTWIVDSRGNRIPTRRRSLHGRTPPPNPDTYNNYKIDLTWSPGGNAEATCAKSCSDAYGLLVNSPCKLNESKIS